MIGCGHWFGLYNFLWRFHIVMSVWDAVGPVLCDLISYCLLLYQVSRTSVFPGMLLCTYDSGVAEHGISCCVCCVHDYGLCLLELECRSIQILC